MNDLALGKAFIDIVAEQAPWAALAVARPFGFTLIFYAFAWGHLNSGMLRMAFAVAIAAPTFGSGLPMQSAQALELALPVLLAKEVFLGTVLGFVASAPLAVALGAGDVIDIYRGASAGIPDPAGGQAPVVGTLLVVVSLWLFAALGGFWLVAQMIYSSYTFWPAVAPMPEFKPDISALLAFLGQIAMAALVLAGPLLAVMFFSDIIHLISAKFGKQINVSYLAFSSKNLIMIAVLPVFLIYAVQALKSSHNDLSDSVSIMRLIFK